MKHLASFTILLVIQLCSPSPSFEKGPPAAPSPLPASNAAAPPLICIDPGHPSEVSSGATVQNGTTEVHVAWVVALKLQKILEAKGYRVVLTKGAEDQLVRNKERALIANRAGAALMVRLHCDASTERGFALYYPDRQGTTQGVTGPTEAVMDASGRAARAIHAGMAEALRGLLEDGGVRGDSKTLVGSRQGALTGSILSEVPVVTIERVVLSNKGDAEFIKSEEGQRKMAQAIADGIIRFVPAPLKASAPTGAKILQNERSASRVARS
jgi:N-acetylmuramoyl-L-alanine amidase